VLFLAGLLYTLSIGPVEIYLLNSRNLPFWQTFYLPILWLHQNTTLEEPLEHYMKGCHLLFDTPEASVAERYPDSQWRAPGPREKALEEMRGS